MAARTVAGERYFEIDGQMLEIKRQLRQPSGYPFDPEMLKQHLQAAVEGCFGKVESIGIISPVVFTREVWEKVYDLLDCTFDEKLWQEPTRGHWDLYVPKDLTPNKVVAAMRKLGITVYLDTDDLDSAIVHDDRDPTKGGYRIRFRANKEADEEFKNLSADQLKKQGVQGITLLERLLLELAYFLATENKGDDWDQRHLDVQNVTYCSGSCGSGVGVSEVRWSPGSRRVCVDWYYPALRFAGLRCRAAISL